MAAFRENALAAREADTQRQMALVPGEGPGPLAAGDLSVRIDADLQEPFATLARDFNAAVDYAARHKAVESDIIAVIDASRSRRTCETGRSLERIIARIGEIGTLVSDISGSAEQQSQGLAQANIAVSEMDGVTQHNAAMVDSSTAAARSLSSEADALSAEIARFALVAPVRRGRRRWRWTRDDRSISCRHSRPGDRCAGR